jgi:hypothetical protein
MVFEFIELLVVDTFTNKFGAWFLMKLDLVPLTLHPTKSNNLLKLVFMLWQWVLNYVRQNWGGTMQLWKKNPENKQAMKRPTIFFARWRGFMLGLNQKMMRQFHSSFFGW